MSNKAAAFFKKLKSARNIRGLQREVIRTVVKVEADNFHADNFKREGFKNKRMSKWPARKKAESPRRSLLVDSGNLKRKATHGVSKKKGVEYTIPQYGRVHNEGLKAGPGKGFKMPQRKFIGVSKELDKRIQKKAFTLITKRLKRL